MSKKTSPKKVRIRIELTDEAGQKATYENDVETWKFTRRPNSYVPFVFDLAFSATCTGAGTLKGTAGRPFGAGFASDDE